jgi:uncharacterized protein (DUF952 family)
MIYHVTKKEAWKTALQNGFYEAASLASEGFIHNSTMPQVAGVLERYYKNETNLVLLHIDETKLTAPLKYELAASVNELFPHIFGPINVDAVVKTETL